MSQRRRQRAASAASGRPLALTAVTELSAEESSALFRRRAYVVIAGAVLFAVIYALLSWLSLIHI